MALECTCHFTNDGRIGEACPSCARQERCTEIADQVVPEYRPGKPPYPSCTGIYAKRWQAAWDAACIALGGDPAEYRR